MLSVPRPVVHVLRLVALLVLLVAGVAGRADAQDPPAGVPAPGRELRVFLDCPQGGCDFDYFRTETPWVAHVRDRTVADVHVLLTRLGTGAGGQEYTIVLIGQGRYAAARDTLRVTTPPSQPSDLNRQTVTRAVQLALVPFAARTPVGARLRIVSDAADRDADRSGVPADDPWNAWVFSVGANGSFESEERKRGVRINGNGSARRITEAWKFGVSGNAFVNDDEFELDDSTTITNRRESYRGGAVAVRSLGDHWGVGAQTSVSSSTFDNTKFAVRLAPAVEYSLFPYDEATRRQLVVQYSIGVSSFRYSEETIFDKLEETRPTQSFVVGYDVQQPWGSADAEIEAASFLDDFQQYRVEVDGSLDLRVLRGLELEIGGRASLVRDQLSIVKRDATPEEILLQRRALLTDYRYSAYVGFSYTFGSIFNSVVNPRFGTGPGSILR